MAPSGSQTSVTSPPIIAPTVHVQAPHGKSQSPFDLTSLSLFHACAGAALLCAVIWTSISYIIFS